MPSLFAGGGAVGDVDNDGDLDLFIVRGDLEANILFLNNDGNFLESQNNVTLRFPNSGTFNYKLSGPSFADLDGDGLLDLFIGGLDGDPSLLFKGDGMGGFVNVTADSGLAGMTSDNTISAAFGDYDGDGDLDVAMAHWGTARLASSPGETETLWRNDSENGVIRFNAVSGTNGISEGLELTVDGKIGRDRDYSFVPNFIDINDDDDLDLLLVSDFRSSRVFENNGDGSFTNVTDTTQIVDSNGMGTDVGDFDNDGRPDWFVSSINGNVLYRNMSGTMIRAETSGAESGSWGWGSCFADFNADGYLDIYQTNGWINNTGASPSEPYDADISRLWLNQGDGTFKDVAEAAGIDDAEQGRSVVCADFDQDHDVDILLLINNSQDGAIYWENTTTGTKAVGVALDGQLKNRAAIGSRISAEIGAQTQTRWVRAGSTFSAQTPPHVLFGLGTSDDIERLVIDWPDGAQTVLSNVSSGQTLYVDHPG